LKSYINTDRSIRRGWLVILARIVSRIAGLKISPHDPTLRLGRSGRCLPLHVDRVTATLNQSGSTLWTFRIAHEDRNCVDRGSGAEVGPVSRFRRFEAVSFAGIHQYAVRHFTISLLPHSLCLRLYCITKLYTKCRRQRHSGSSSAAAVSPACQQR
jgi:hypothetical protein